MDNIVLRTESIKKIQIVILLGAPLTAQNYERVGIPYLSKHFEVLVFDCIEWLGRNNKEVKYKKASWDKILPIKSKLELEDQIKKISPQYAIDFIGFGNLTLDICIILAKYNVKFVIQKTGSLPIPNISLRIKTIVIKFFRENKTGSLVDLKNINPTVEESISIGRLGKIFGKIHAKLRRVTILIKLKSLPNYIGLIAGYKSLDPFTRSSNPIIWIGSHDYHTFYKAKNELALNKDPQINGPFILFIDDALVNASDWTLLGLPAPVTGKTYYAALNAFFEKIESVYDMPVKIAGHPNSIVDENYSSKIGGRSVIYDSTAKLVLQSSLVLVHGSTATSFAVLARKPILHITTLELDQTDYGLHVRVMSKSLGTELIFIDIYNRKKIDLKEIPIDECKYRLYEVNFLCNERSSEIEPWGGLVDFIKNSA